MFAALGDGSLVRPGFDVLAAVRIVPGHLG
jgi:hypothetical protein